MRPFEDGGIVQALEAERGQPLEQLVVAFRRPSRAGLMLDVVDPHRLIQDQLRRPAVVRGVAKHGVEMEGEQFELGIASEIEPLLPRQQREVTAGVRVEGA